MKEPKNALRVFLLSYVPPIDWCMVLRPLFHITGRGNGAEFHPGRVSL